MSIFYTLNNLFRKEGYLMSEKAQAWIVSGQPAPKVENLTAPEKPRLSWLGELSGKEIDQFLQKMHHFSGCHYCIYENNAKGEHSLNQCKKGNDSWWNELVTFDQFRRDAVWE